MPIGTFGRISRTYQPNGTAKARARFRDHTGTVRTVSRFGPTKQAAENSLRAALAEEQAATEGLSRSTTLTALAAAWLTEIETSDRATQTKEVYTYAATRYIGRELGAVRIGEATTGVCDAALKRITVRHGPGAAKTAKAVLNGMFSLAVRHDAATTNPVRETQPISRTTRKPVRALTPAEADDLCDRLRSSDRAIDLDLPDLVEFMLGTGARIGEAAACRDDALDREAGTWEINATIIRIKGQGLIVQERPKTAAGWRVLALPPFAAAMLERRAGEIQLRGPEGVVFSSPKARALRDPSNTAGDLREVLDALGYHWVTSHVFRKTVATRLDEAGLSAREIANILGHAQPSMTLNVYMGRRVVSADMARILDR